MSHINRYTIQRTRIIFEEAVIEVKEDYSAFGLDAYDCAEIADKGGLWVQVDEDDTVPEIKERESLCGECREYSCICCHACREPVCACDYDDREDGFAQYKSRLKERGGK